MRTIREMFFRLQIISFLVLVSLLVVQGCSFTGNIAIQDANIGGDEIGTVATNTAQQHNKIIERADREFSREFVPDKKFIDSVKKGEDDAREKFSRSRFGQRLYRVVSEEPWPELNEEFLTKNQRIKSCRKELQLIASVLWDFNARILIVECSRSHERQAKLKESGASQTLMSQHNYYPSNAFDFVPVDGRKLLWENLPQYGYVIGMLRIITARLAQRFGFRCHGRSGADWKGQGKTYTKTTLRDWAHWACREDGQGYTSDKNII